MKFADYKAFEMTADAVEKDMENFDRIAKTADAMRLDHAQFEARAKLHHYDLVRCSHEPYAAYRSDLTNAALAGWRGANGGAVPQTQPDERAESDMRAAFAQHMGQPWEAALEAARRIWSLAWGASRFYAQQAQPDERAALIAERDAAIMSTHRQAICIQLCAAHIGPETSATIEGLPNAVKRLVKERDAVRATAPQSDHYQQLLGVAYVVLGCLAANGVDIPVRFLDAFSDPDSVENPLELLPCDFSPARAVRAAVEAAALTDEQRESIRYARSVMGSVSWETPDSIRAKAVLDALLAATKEGS